MRREIKSRHPPTQVIELIERLAAGDWEVLSFTTVIDDATRTATIEVKLNAKRRNDVEPEFESEPAGIVPGVPVRDVDL